MLFLTSGLPNSVACASIEVNTIVSTVIATNVAACSMLANFHQRRQRAMFASSGVKV